MLVDNGLELLTTETAWELLRCEGVGRVGITLGALPVILPVNFVVLDDAIVFRTAPGSKLSAAASGAVVAFEVDRHDRETRTGWSVLVVGRSEVVHDIDVTFEALAAGLEPLAGGTRASLVRIHPELVSGRRLVQVEQPQADPAARSDVVYLAEAVDQPFADVCRLLTEASTHMDGSMVAISDSMATLDLDPSGDGHATAELRILPIRGGTDAMTELMLISTDEEGTPVRHDEHVAGARSQLDGIVRIVEDVSSPELGSARSSVARQVTPRTASVTLDDLTLAVGTLHLLIEHLDAEAAPVLDRLAARVVDRLEAACDAAYESDVIQTRAR